jgi:hypothetical protein
VKCLACADVVVAESELLIPAPTMHQTCTFLGPLSVVPAGKRQPRIGANLGEWNNGTLTGGNGESGASGEASCSELDISRCEFSVRTD